MIRPEFPPGTIVVASSSSSCAECGRPVLPHAERHEDVSGYTPQKGGGCGVVFTHITTDYVGEAQRRTAEMRPDLIFIPIAAETQELTS